MAFIKFIILIAIYYLLIYAIGRLLLKRKGISLGNVILGIFGITISIFLIYLSRINFQQAGFQTGNFKKGFIMLLISFVLILGSLGSMRKMSFSDLMKIPYGNFRNNKIILLHVWMVVGPTEELFYRGFIQGNLRMFLPGSIFSIEYATIIATIIFVFAHLNNLFFGRESIKQFISLLPGRIIMGSILGYTFQISNSLIYPIIIHTLSDGLTITYLIILKKRFLNNYHS
ncbi:hypothetical protein X928_10270 [Petrotoga miotherma DSM 10691]|uniref:CAAX prenyl protease 2/Lysostaphin resistance protein A-like domain-containing protein n=1 Tax=Petrotoga miotherma DSM 10691 TaxID=1434326 RepID=A0A2K1P3L9_9BACT|nr:MULTISPECIES: type II CAAX endopeptidase family protein [Petrotoga]PNR97370.1 hypothetical protein X928_10270 [Petrotoga miotherma DSM 10691]